MASRVGPPPDRWRERGGRRGLRGWLLAAAVLVLLASGVGGYLVLGFDPVDAVFYTVMTLTTEGFVAPTPLSNAAKVLTAGLALLGVTAFLAILGVGATAVMEGQLALGSRRRRMDRRIRGRSNHHIVCAYGRVGRAAARELEADGTPFVVIEADPGLEEDLRSDGVDYLIGNSSSEALLISAGIERAATLVCAVDSDAVNVYITVMARSLNPRIAIVARASEDAAADRLHRAGANHVVSPYAISGRRMAMLALHPNMVEFFDLAGRGDGELRLEELLVTDESSLASRPLRELGGGAVPLLIRRADGELLAHPGPDIQLCPGDALVVLGDPTTLRPIDHDPRSGPPPPHCT